MKHKWIKIVTMTIVIGLGIVWLSGCAGPQKIQFRSCEEFAGEEVECRTFEITGEASILPF